MKKFMVVYRMDMAAANKMMTENPELAKKGMEDWGIWMKKHEADFADAGAPLGKNTQMSATGSVEMSNDLAGYSILQAESKEAALAVLADNPHFQMSGATADVMEVVAMPM